MRTLSFDKNNELVVPRKELLDSKIDIGGRDVYIGFNEPKFKFSDQDLNEPDLDAKLNARLITYFLPAVYIAQQQKVRPRLYLISALNLALKWNTYSERERKILMINNNLKLDFIEKFFERFFPEAFSVVEFVVAQDPLKIPEEKLFEAWNVLEEKYPKEIGEVKVALGRFLEPKLFSVPDHLSPEAQDYLQRPNQDLRNAFAYAISHLFVFADLNFEGNYIHNPVGYLSIGGHQERYFNVVRRLGYEHFSKNADTFFGREVILKNNLKLVLEAEAKVPPAYNHSLKSKGGHAESEEVTYENGRPLDYYDQHKKLHYEMQFMYEHFANREAYEGFWNTYKNRYFELKRRYREAYKMSEDF